MSADARTGRRLLLVGALSALAGCEDPKPTKAELLKKVEGARSKTDVEKALGAPANVDKLGPAERWTYEARDGVVIVTIVAGYVAFKETGERRK